MDERSPRVPVISTKEQLPDDQHEQYDVIADSRGTVSGPFTVLLNSPEIAGRAGHLGAYIRFEGVLAGRERELAIIATAREFDCAYEWAVHAPIARREGVPEDTIEVVVDQKPADELPATDAAVVRYVRELLRENAVSEATFERAEDRYDARELTELTATVGYYSMLACVLNAFEVRPETSPPFSS